MIYINMDHVSANVVTKKIRSLSSSSYYAIPLHRLLSRTGGSEQNTNYMNTVPVETKGVWISALENIRY